MINADIVLIWPYSEDYPLFRKTLRKIRNKVKTVNIFFSEHHSGKHIDSFIRKSLSELGVDFFEDEGIPLPGKGDWVNTAVNTILRNVSSEWFLKIHPDFFVKDWDSFLGSLGVAMKRNQLIGYPYLASPDYFSPAFFLMERSLLEKTSLDFSAISSFRDHFWKITADARKLGIEIMPLEKIGLRDGIDYVHIKGVTTYFVHGLVDDFHFYDSPERAYCYFHQTLNCGELMEEKWEEKLKRIMRRLETIMPGFDPESHWISDIIKSSTRK